MKKFLFAWLLYLFTLPLFAQNTILLIGDSVSAGYGIEQKNGWAALLNLRLQKTHPSYHIINSSISGDTTSDGLIRLPTALKQYKPIITMIELGGNDGLRGLQLMTIQQNIARMIELIQAAHSKVLLLGVRMPPNYGPAYTEQFQQIYQKLAKSYAIPVVPNILKGIDDNPKLMQSDGIHPTSEAQPLILENVMAQLKNMLQ